MKKKTRRIGKKVEVYKLTHSYIHTFVYSKHTYRGNRRIHTYKNTRTYTCRNTRAYTYRKYTHTHISIHEQLPKLQGFFGAGVESENEHRAVYTLIRRMLVEFVMEMLNETLHK